MTIEHVAPVIDLVTRSRVTRHPAGTGRVKIAAGEQVPAPAPTLARSPVAGLLRVAEMALRAHRALNDGVAPDQVEWWSTQRDTYLNALMLVAWPTSAPGVIRQAVSAMTEALDARQIRTPADLVSAAQSPRP